MLIEPKEENAFSDLKKVSKEIIIDMLFVTYLMDTDNLCIANDCLGKGEFELRPLSSKGMALQDVSKEIVKNLFDCEFITLLNDQPGNVLIRSTKK